MKIRKVKYLGEWHYCFKVGCGWYVGPIIETGEWLMYEEGKALMDYEQTRNKISLMTQDEIKKFLNELDATILLGPVDITNYKMTYTSVYTLIKGLKYTNNIFGIAGDVVVDADKVTKNFNGSESLGLFLAKNGMALAFLGIERWPSSGNNYTSAGYLARPDCIVLAKIGKPSALTKLTKEEANKVKANKKVFKTDLEMQSMRDALLNTRYDGGEPEEEEEDEDKKKLEQTAALPFKSNQGELAQEELDEGLIKIDGNFFTYSGIVAQLLNEMGKMGEGFVCLMLRKAIHNLRDKLKGSLFINDKDFSVIFFPFATNKESFFIQGMTRYMPIKVNMEEESGHIIANELVQLFVSQLFYNYK